MNQTDDLRIQGITEVLPPENLHLKFPLSENCAALIGQTRQAIHRILQQQDPRLLVVVGPCSIHDVDAGMEYARRLRQIQQDLPELLLVMRVYFEKPRTTVGWKGLINDPDLDGSFRINRGLSLARRFLRDVNELGVPCGTEFLDLISPQYVADLISWGAIGARTTESQGHRELASGLSCPVGFKNGTDGGCKIAADAMMAATQPHVFMSLTKQGTSAIFKTKGNEDGHIILRGGIRPNYDAASVAAASTVLQKSGLEQRIMIDFSHANSAKDHNRQVPVGEDVAGQIQQGNKDIMGVLLESHLKEGRQNVLPGQDLVYGQSITDACLSWDKTVPLLHTLADAVRQRGQGG